MVREMLREKIYFDVFKRLREIMQKFHNFMKYVVHCITLHSF